MTIRLDGLCVGTLSGTHLLLVTVTADRGLPIVSNQLRQRRSATATTQLGTAVVRAVRHGGDPGRGAARGGGLDRLPDLGLAEAHGLALTAGQGPQESPPLSGMGTRTAGSRKSQLSLKGRPALRSSLSCCVTPPWAAKPQSVRCHVAPGPASPSFSPLWHRRRLPVSMHGRRARV